MKKICVVTATRAEFGLLKPIINELSKSGEFDVRLVATGMHLSDEFGLTYKEIESDGYEIDEKIDILLSGDSTAAMAKTMGMTMISFADYFKRSKPDYLFAIADRYEIMAVCATAMCERIPIIHYMGGETSEGAIDECARHSITKMSQLHFCCTEEYRKRIIQLGESPDRVFNVGSTGVENIKTLNLLNKHDLYKELGLDEGRHYAVMTFHPVTLEDDTARQQIINVLLACRDEEDIDFVITKSNADAAGRAVNSIVEDFVKDINNMRLYDSLGSLRYLSALKYAEFVIGNSSSGLLEAPSFKIPTVNIGDRQKGRTRAKSVIDCGSEVIEVKKAIRKARSESFIDSIKDVINPYEGKSPSQELVKILCDCINRDVLQLKKSFYSL